MTQVLFVPHGGGPLPLLGDPGHDELVAFLKAIPDRLARPAAILVISAHWEEDRPTLTAAPTPELIYDYYGFPDASYEIAYPAPGQPALAGHIRDLLRDSGIDARLDSRRGFDHGLFVPLKLMYPGADIPCVQLSLCADMDPARHLAIGQALASLGKENLLVLGSGFSFHNLQVMLRPGTDDGGAVDAFSRWLIETCCEEGLTSAERDHRLVDWVAAPKARFCHPREEHLLPLHVCHGIGGGQAELVFDGKVLGRRALAMQW